MKIVGRVVRVAGLLTAVLTVGLVSGPRLGAAAKAVDGESAVRWSDQSGFAEPAGYAAAVPVRVLDTRFGRGAPSGKLEPGGTLSVDLAARVDVTTTAVVLNVTADSADADGFLTVFPCDVSSPDVSNLNFRDDETRAALVTVRLPADRRVCVTTSAAVHVIVDFSGAYSTDAMAGYTPLAPVRTLDTRGPLGSLPTLLPGVELRLPLTDRPDVPDSGVVAVAVNVTVVHPSDGGYVTVYPCGTPPPDVSNINFKADAVIANLVIVKLGADGAVCFVSSAPVDLLADLTGFYAAPLTAGFVPLTPTRVVDTRFGVDARTTVFVPASRSNPYPSLTLNVAAAVGRDPSSLAAVVANITALSGSTTDYLTVSPSCNNPLPPKPSTLNFDGHAVSNLVSASLAPDGTVCLSSLGRLDDLIVDIAGIFTTNPTN